VGREIARLDSPAPTRQYALPMRNMTFVLVGLLVLAAWVKTRQARPSDAAGAAAHAVSAQSAATEDDAGWTPVPMPAGAISNRVLVFSALNCPKAAAQRALAIIDELGTQGVPCVHTDSVSFPTATPEEAARLTKVMNGGAPVVFVNGKAKSCPLVEEIVAEYRAISRRG
jgi:hypothetical protein